MLVKRGRRKATGSHAHRFIIFKIKGMLNLEIIHNEKSHMHPSKYNLTSALSWSPRPIGPCFPRKVVYILRSNYINSVNLHIVKKS